MKTRILATLVAIASLLWLGLNAWEVPLFDSDARSSATLWTAGIQPEQEKKSAGQFSVSKVAPLPKGISRIPDVAFLRRTHPELQHLLIQGDGVDSADVPILHGLPVSWTPSPAGKNAPEISQLTWTQQLSVGQSFVVRGTIHSLPAGAAVALTLEAPDGNRQTLELNGTTASTLPFLFTAGAAVAPGRFEWKLQLGAKNGWVLLNALVSVPTVPNVLLLQASPNVEAARLQRWLLANGAEVSSRTLISTDRLRGSSNVPNASDVTAVNAGLLAKFDVVVTTDSGLLELKPAERAALENAIRLNRLGLLVFGESVLPGPIDALSPWHRIGLEKSENGADTTLVGAQLANGVELTDPASALSGDLNASPFSFVLVRDSYGRALVAAVKRGLGTVARSRIVDTWHWLQDGQPATYASFWSTLLTTLARPAKASDDFWKIIEPVDSPLFVDEPIRLSWTHPQLKPATSAQVMGEGSTPVVLPLQTSASEGSEASATFWPVHAGWHDVRTTQDGPPFTFYVQPKNALPGVRAEARHRTTALLVEAAKSSSGNTPFAAFARPRWFRSDLIACALFSLSVIYLWWQQRRSRPV